MDSNNNINSNKLKKLADELVELMVKTKNAKKETKKGIFGRFFFVKTWDKPFFRGKV